MVRLVRASALVGALVVCAVPLSAQRISRRVYLDVIDGSGTPVAGLTATDFKVTENGQTRQVLRAAMNPQMRILLLVDTSRSMEPMLNHFRAGIAAFIDAVPPGPEIGLMTMGGPLRPRVTPAVDRQKLMAVTNSLSPDGGPNSFYETLMEVDRRFMSPKPANNAWPVYVILTTDFGDSRQEPDVEAFNRMVNDFIWRGGNAHAIIIRGQRFGIISEIAQNFVENAAGTYDPLAISNALPDKMKALGERIASDRELMANRYEVEYQTDAKAPPTGIEVEVLKEGARVRMSPRRPF